MGVTLFYGPAIEIHTQSRPAVFGLKGRFSQPRPKAWQSRIDRDFEPERLVHRRGSLTNGPVQGRGQFLGTSTQAFGLG